MLVLTAVAIPARADDPPVALAPNDHCGIAQDISGGGEFPGNTLLALNNYSARNGEGFFAPELVYRFTLPSLKQITVDVTDADFFTVVYIRRICSERDSEIAFENRMGRGLTDVIRLNLPAGTYYLFIDGDSGSYFHRGLFTLRFGVTNPPRGDRCANPLTLRRDEPAIGNTYDFAADYQSPNVASAGRDVVFRYTTSVARDVVISSMGSRFDTTLYVRTSCSNASTEIAWNDDAAGKRQSIIEISLELGTYFIILDGYHWRSAGEFTVTLT